MTLYSPLAPILVAFENLNWKGITLKGLKKSTLTYGDGNIIDLNKSSYKIKAYVLKSRPMYSTEVDVEILGHFVMVTYSAEKIKEKKVSIPNKWRIN